MPSMASATAPEGQTPHAGHGQPEPIWGGQAPADLSRVRHPVLVANGDHDKVVPSSNSADLARRLPELVLYDDAGHGGIFHYHSAFVNKALAFLEASEAS